MIAPLRVRGPLTESVALDTDSASAGGVQTGSPADARRARQALAPDEWLSRVEASGLQRRGRWGERVAEQWRRVLAAGSAPRHVVCHAGLLGPGAGADRLLVEAAPHLVVEGLLLAATALGVETAHLCLAHGHDAGEEAARGAIGRARDASPRPGRRRAGRSKAAQAARPDAVDGVVIDVSRLPEGTALCGDGTALLEALEGRAPRPRARPPEPGTRGLSDRPTWIADAETCAWLALIAQRGVDGFRARGEADHPGTTLFEVGGDVERPGFYELPLGTRLGELVFEHAGGVTGGRKVGFVVPGGSSGTVLPPGLLDVPLSATALAALGADLGRGEVFVVAADACMVAAAERLAASCRRMACGGSVHCRVGTAWIHERLVELTTDAGAHPELDHLLSLCDALRSDRHCGLADAIAHPVRSLVDLYPDEFASHARGEGCARPGAAGSRP